MTLSQNQKDTLFDIIPGGDALIFGIETGIRVHYSLGKNIMTEVEFNSYDRAVVYFSKN